MSLKLTQFRVIDLFCGCGGLSLGLQNAGFNIVAGFDNWKLALDIYQKNFKHPSFLMDLGNLQGDFSSFKMFNPDIIVGGPPCQDFSSAGKRDESLGRGDLTLVFAEIVATIQPQFFIMENVARFIKTQKYKQAKTLLKSADYGLSEIILDASLCGVPQIRKRFFWIGEFQGKDDQFKQSLEANLSSKSLTIRDYFNQISKPLDIDHYYRHPRSYQRRGIFSIDEPSPTIRSVNRPIPKTYQPHPGDSALISPEVRPLTTLERSYIQTFPETFIFTGSKTHLEQIIANAVPVKLAEYVGRCLIHDCVSTEGIKCVNY
ncbi:DNA cytosine methyltransferase [Planktothrix pseudagardhii]|uniref:Cytosine-specific methyltransferase n=1 Tax=Planktothrix pseudagardhii TaxID=132604 RepID=A0A9W4CRZ9_9CYAN|nr:DNA cytosine methyltransferase [Planktothrix pseudagardhii]CAD5980660.1 Modification methylase HgiDI [Planktothrix pseudagardhii]